MSEDEYDPCEDSEGPQDWTDDSEQEWAVEGVHRKEIHGAKWKPVYEVRWDDWKRKPDGTNNTWETEIDIVRDAGQKDPIKAFDKRVQTSFQRRAKDSEPWQGFRETQGQIDIHRDRTREFAQGCVPQTRTPYRFSASEMLAKAMANGRICERVNERSSEPPEQPEQKPMIMRASSSASRTLSSTGRSPSVTSNRSSHSGQSRASSSKSMDVDNNVFWDRSTPSSSSTAATSVGSSSSVRPHSSRIASQRLLKCHDAPSASPSSSRKGKGRAIPMSPVSTMSSERVAAMHKLSPRKRMENLWTEKAKEAGSAPITFVNQIDNEQLPDVSEDFVYLERSYVYGEGAYPPPDNDDFLLRCECKVCSKPERCGCQDNSTLEDETGKKIIAYDKKGLFTFAAVDNQEVIECNKYCLCSPVSCPNRVAQRPRDFPIQIFKTDLTGWGARCPEDLVKGKVLGLYTGTVVSRDAANKPGNNYKFDLDAKESPEEDNDFDKFTIDATIRGNWTRFINHSCAPNLMVYNVVFDTVPEANMPYLAYVALEDIKAGTELTFDYHGASYLSPLTANKSRKRKRSRVETPPPGAERCQCGAPNCRGWFYW